MPRPKAAQVQQLEHRYIDGAKLMDLLARLFPPRTYAAEVSVPVDGKAYFQALPSNTGRFHRSEEGSG